MPRKLDEVSKKPDSKAAGRTLVASKPKREPREHHAAPAPLRPTWRIQRVKLGELQPWARNPRRISEQQSARLRDSFDQFGQVELLALGPNLEVYDGHQRLKVLSEQFGPDYEVEAQVCSRALSEKEREKLTVYLHRGAAGDFDLEVLLREFDPAELNEWGMTDLNVPNVPEEEWKGMPEFNGNPRFHARIAVMFADDESMAVFSQLVGQEVNKGTTSIWYPKETPEQREQALGSVWEAEEQSA